MRPFVSIRSLLRVTATRTESTRRRAETSERTIVVGPGAGVLPIMKARPLVVWCASERDDERDDDDPEEAEDLDDGGEDLGLAVNSDRHEVDQDDEGEADGYHQRGGDVGPVRDDDGRGGDLGGDGDGVLRRRNQRRSENGSDSRRDLRSSRMRALVECTNGVSMGRERQKGREAKYRGRSQRRGR